MWMYVNVPQRQLRVHNNSFTFISFFPQQIFYYSESIFEGAGVSIDHIPYAIIGTGVINLATTLNSVNILNFWLFFF